MSVHFIVTHHWQLLLLTAYGSGLGSGYADGYGGGAMKGSAYAAKAPGPYGGMKLHHIVLHLFQSLCVIVLKNSKC